VSGFDNPIVLVTRPRQSSEAYIEELRKKAGPFEGLIRPAFEHEPINVQIPQFDEAIFTSKAGVAFAPDGKGRIAWCVGDATSQAAKALGFEARSASGNAADLAALILKQNPKGRLLHIRGEITYGNIRDTISQHGIRCEETIVYRKTICEISTSDLAGRIAGRNIILPLFSAETVSILSSWTPIIGTCHIVALSAAVASKASILKPLNLTTAEDPSLASMVYHTACLIA